MTDTDLDVRLANGTADEVDAAVRLRSLVGRWDLTKWLYTTTVLIDGASGQTFSHPVLTLQPSDIPGDDHTGLSIFLHEQMHWAAQTLRGTSAAIVEARQAFPSPPAHDAGGARDPESTWLHFVVCALHLGALAEVLGEETARAVVGGHGFYRWIHATILEGEQWSSDYLRRHDLVLPPVPPPWDAPGSVVDVDTGLRVQLVTGHPLERVVADDLVALHAQFPLATERRCPDVAVNATARPSIDPVPTLGARVAGDRLAVLAHYVELQHQWHHARRPDGPLPRELEALVPPSRDERLPTAQLRAIVAACADTLSVLTELLGGDEAARLTTSHPLNGELYAELAAVTPSG